MSVAGWLPWLLEAFTAGFVIWLWQQLLRVRRGARRLVQEGKVGELPGSAQGSAPARDALGDLYRLEERLRELGEKAAQEECRWQAFLSHALEGVMVLDPQLHVRLVNQRLQDLFLLPRAPLGRTALEVFRSHRLHQALQRALGAGLPQFEDLALEVREADGFLTKHFQVAAAPVRPNREGRPTELLVVFHDASQLRELEAVRKDFVANVSHELRTPLSILYGYLETLLDGDVDPPTARRFLETMRRHAERLRALLEGLLLLSQLESRRLPLGIETVRVKDYLERVVDRFESVIAEAGASVTVSAPAALTFAADALRLEQALFNLVDNALKYGTKPGLRLTLSAQSDGEEVVLRVADNGPGIPLSDQPHLFERFYRVDKGRCRDAGGAGLGLSIVKHAVQAHGGSVSVESSPGKGATFILRFPRAAKL